MQFRVTLITISLFLMSCRGGFTTHDLTLLTSPSNSQSGATSGTSLEPSPDTGGLFKNPLKPECSDLDFSGIEVKLGLTEKENWLLAVAMNISSSFEGAESWENLSNNFDGMGFSLGLLQQNLGQGSLQPLLISYLENFVSIEETVLSKNLSSDQLESFQRMLIQWNGGPIQFNSQNKKNIKTNEKIVGSNEQELFPDSQTLNHLDFLDETNRESKTTSFKVTLSPKNQTSVDWSLSNVYNPQGVFFPSWKKALQEMAGSNSYRGLQLKSSLTIFKKASSYAQFFQLESSEALFLMYDFVVQNGGFNLDQKNQILSWRQQNSTVAEKDFLKKILEIRLASVRNEYRKDVQNRKMTIIEGLGNVHGQMRNLPKEYCYSN